MNLDLFPLQHHPHIYGRFLFNDRSDMDKLCRELNASFSTLYFTGESISICINQVPPIACISLVASARMKQGEISMLTSAIQKHGLSCVVFPKDRCSTISIWKPISRGFAEDLRILDDEWSQGQSVQDRFSAIMNAAAEGRDA